MDGAKGDALGRPQAEFTSAVRTKNERGSPKNECFVGRKMDNSKMVPLKALQNERKKFKLKINQLEEEKMETNKINAVDNGAKGDALGCSQAEFTSAERTKNDKGTPQNECFEGDYLSELAQLVQNPYYSDCAQKIDELKSYAISNNTTLKNAYNILYAEDKFEEIKKQTEAELQSKLSAKQATAIAALTTGSNANAESKPKLTEAQKEAARLYGMTEEEFWKYS